MSYDALIKYLEWMNDKGLIITIPDNDGHEKVSLTKKGQEACSTIVVWINDMLFDPTNGK